MGEERRSICDPSQARPLATVCCCHLTADTLVQRAPLGSLESPGSAQPSMPGQGLELKAVTHVLSPSPGQWTLEDSHGQYISSYPTRGSSLCSPKVPAHSPSKSLYPST